MAVNVFENALLRKFGESGTDGVTNNDKRTECLYVGGHPFTIILKDSEGVQNDVKVQVNNSNALDPNKSGHSLQPLQLGLQTSNNEAVDKGFYGGKENPRKESSASTSDFASNWIDMPGGATIDGSVSGYVGSGEWRWIRLVTGTEMKPTLSGYAWSQYQDYR